MDSTKSFAICSTTTDSVKNETNKREHVASAQTHIFSMESLEISAHKIHLLLEPSSKSQNHIN